MTPIKFLIFDAIVVATLIVGACHLLDQVGLTAHRSMFLNLIITPYADDERAGSLDMVHGAMDGDAEGGPVMKPQPDDEPPVNQHAPLTKGGQAELDAAKPQPDDEPSANPRVVLSKGDRAELFGEKSVLSMPVWVESVSISSQDGSITYGLISGLSGHAIPDVEEKYVHAYEVYPPGTHAMCNMPSSSRQKQVPCRVKKHYATNNGRHGRLNTLSYLVTYRDRQGAEMIVDNIPSSMVQRVICKDTLRDLDRQYKQGA